MSDLAEEIARILLHHGDPPMSWNQAQRLAKAITFSGLFSITEYPGPEYDVEAVMGGRGDTSYGEQITHYKGLKTVRTWTYTDG